MAVYERCYKPYEGEVTPEQSRFLVLPRYAYQRIFRSRLFLAFFCLWFVYPLFLAVMILSLFIFAFFPGISIWLLGLMFR